MTTAQWILAGIGVLGAAGVKRIVSCDVVDVMEWIVLDFSGQTKKALEKPRLRDRLISRMDSVLRRLPLAAADLREGWERDALYPARTAILVVLCVTACLAGATIVVSFDAGLYGRIPEAKLSYLYAAPGSLFLFALAGYLVFRNGLRQSKFVRCRIYKILLLNQDSRFSEMERELAVLAEAATDPADKTLYMMDRAYCLSRMGKPQEGLALLSGDADAETTEQGQPGSYRKRLFKLPLRSDYFRVIQERWLDPKIQRLSLLLQLRETEKAREELGAILRKYPKSGRDPRPGLYRAALLLQEGESGEAEMRMERIREEGDETWCDELLRCDPALAEVWERWPKAEERSASVTF